MKLSVFVLTASILSSCDRRTSIIFPHGKPSFTEITGIRFTEVKRRFDTGLSFDKQGFQLEPEWDLYILSDSTVKIYSPGKKSFITYPYFFDHDSVFNMARTWLRLKKTSRDSLVFQLLSVANMKISRNRSNAYMTFYSDSYIKNVLHTDAGRLKRPDKRDSVYIRGRAEIANAYPDSAFSARIPVSLESKSPIIQVEKVEPLIGPLSDADPSDSYLHPEFNITIHKAYRDFYYSFSVFVDEKGLMHFNRSENVLSDDFEEHYIQVMKGIMNVYLQNLLKITPGRTLGISHTSKIIVNVKGRKAAPDDR